MQFILNHSHTFGMLLDAIAKSFRCGVQALEHVGRELLFFAGWFASSFLSRRSAAQPPPDRTTEERRKKRQRKLHHDECRHS